MPRNRSDLTRLLVLTVLAVLSALPANPASAQNHLWSRGHGDFRPDEANGVAIGPDGSVVIVGAYERTVDFGGGAVTAVDFLDAYAVKYTAEGNHVWTRSFGGSNDDVASAVAIDGNGNVLVVGHYWQSTDLGEGPVTGNGRDDMFLVLYDADGNLVWTRTWGGIDFDRAWGVTVDDLGNWTVAADFSGTVDFGQGPVSSNGGGDGLILRLNAAGVAQWTYTFGSVLGDERAFDVGLDAVGNVYTSGSFSRTTDFGGGNIPNQGNADAFVLSLDGSGNFRWARGFGASGPDVASDLAVDSQGRVTVGGGFNGSVDFGGGTLASAGGDDMFLVQFDASGAHQWSQRFGDSNLFQQIYSVDRAPGDAVTVVGRLSGTADFGGGPIVANSTSSVSDGFVASFQADGTHRWSQLLGGAGVDQANAVACASNGDFVVAGTYGGTIDLGGGPLPNTSSIDLFIVKFADPVATSTPSADLRFAMHAPYPNPFNPRVQVTFDLERDASAELLVHDAKGRRVAVLFAGDLAEGRHAYVWNGVDARGSAVASGVYRFTLRVGNERTVRQAVLLR